MGGFDLDAAQAVWVAAPRSSAICLFDQLSLLVDKSLVVAEDDKEGRCVTGCWRRSVSTHWKDLVSQERATRFVPGIEITTRRRPATLSAFSDVPARWRLAQAEVAIDNLRAAFAWSRDNGDVERALALTSMLVVAVGIPGPASRRPRVVRRRVPRRPACTPSNPRLWPGPWQTEPCSMRN